MTAAHPTDPPPLHDLLHVAHQHTPAVVSPPGVAASVARLLGDAAAEAQVSNTADPHLVALAIQVLNAALVPTWTGRDLDRHPHG